MLKFMYITNNPVLAKYCEEFGVDRVFVDMECIGKEERQKGLDSVKSYHTLDDVVQVRKALQRTLLLVRLNPLHDGTKKEINETIARGADILMLPMVRKPSEANKFIKLVNGRVKTILLLETCDAVKHLDQILQSGFDEVHIGLNDLSLDYKIPFMFTLLTNGTVETLCSQIRKYGIPYGFGGIARLGGGVLPASKILMEHIRLKSSMVILSRSFLNASKIKDNSKVRITFGTEIYKLRNAELAFSRSSKIVLEANKQYLSGLTL